MLHRRAMLLAPAALAIPGVARADDPPVVAPQVTTPAPITAPPAPPPVPAPVPPATLPQPSTPASPTAAPRPPAPAPATPPAPGIDRTKIYYVFYEQTIDLVSMRALRRQLTSLVEAGVSEINLVINSPGGLITPTFSVYSLIRALPARINTHATGFVASAACLLFLAGQNRTADRAARFLFHPAQVPVTGTLNGQQMQDRLVAFDTINATTTQIYKDRTSLTDAEIERFGRQEVFYTAEQALANGVIQSIADLHIPGEQKARILFLD